MSDGRLTLQEAADRLGVHYMTAYRYVRLGILPARKVDAQWQVEAVEVEALRTPSPSRGGKRQRVAWDQRLAARLLAGDGAGSWSVLEAALAAGTTPEGALLDVLAPAMRTIGDEWAAGRVDVAHEHRASVLANRLLGRMGSRFTRRGRSRGTVVLGCVAGEQHALPVGILADVLRGHGWSVVDLGADVPDESFALVAGEQDQLVAVGVSVTTPACRDGIDEALAAIRGATSAPVLVGGGAIGSAADAAALGGDGWAPDARGLVEVLHALVPA